MTSSTEVQIRKSNSKFPPPTSDLGFCDPNHHVLSTASAQNMRPLRSRPWCCSFFWGGVHELNQSN